MPCRLEGAETQPYRNAMLLRELEYAADMIVVLMRDDDCVDLVRQHMQPRKPLLCLPYSETAVDHYRSLARLRGGGDQQGIAFAAAA